MKPYIVILCMGMGLPLAVSAQSTDTDLATLKEQFDAQYVTAVMPVVLPYAEKLQKLLGAALKRKDAQAASKIEETLSDLQKNTEVNIPPPEGDTLATIIEGTIWKANKSGRELTFEAQGAVSGSWGEKGHWQVEGRRVTIRWEKTPGDAPVRFSDASVRALVLDERGRRELWLRTPKPSSP